MVRRDAFQPVETVAHSWIPACAGMTDPITAREGTTDLIAACAGTTRDALHHGIQSSHRGFASGAYDPTMTSAGTTTTIDIAIIGAGAAGLATAIFAARELPAARIVAFDGARKLGAKILVSGGGRCNVTNVRVTPADFWGGSSNTVKNVLAAFDGPRAVEFFRELGVTLHEEEWGKLFPDSNEAKTVLDALVAEARRLGVELRSGHRVESVCRQGKEFALQVSQAALTVPCTSDLADRGAEPTPGRAWEARRVVLATGGRSLPKTGSDGAGYPIAEKLGHSIIPTTPALVPLVLSGRFHAPLSGIAHDVEVIVDSPGAKPSRHVGPMLWTHFGVSGPAILDASRHWHRARLHEWEVAVRVNMLPGMDFASAEARWAQVTSQQPRITLNTALATLIPARVAEAVLAELGLPPRVTLANLPREHRRRLLQGILAWPLPVQDSRGYGYAEATAGGVPLTEVHPGTMGSRKCAGLYLVGEILDVDGRIGGFNFQWAWSSAYVAGRELARDLAGGRK
ncbi:MAG: NAD(P)/FAD-dependent oxidoreductase [Phycisphaerales bacterium]|nr:NAD(P)/FAD-dependent oxidoreductase [Phycisphaerales bacterium]